MDTIETEIEESEGIVSKIVRCTQQLEQAVTPPTSSTDAIHTTRSSSVTLSTPHAKPRLPKLSFRGDITNWTTFWDSYKSAIHTNSELTKIDKFNYLHSLLEGQAARAIKGLTLTEANYDSAVELLEQWFGRPQQIITAHMDELIKIPSCTSERPQQLRVVFDQITVHIRGFSTMGINSKQYRSLLIPMIMSKLLSEMRLRVARETTDEVWKIDELMDVIKKEVEARQASEGTKFKSSLPGARIFTPSHNVPTASALVAQNHYIRCVYCNGQHFSASCDKICRVKERKDILIKSGHCFNCLKLNHKTKECQNTKTCRKCHRKHHQSIYDGLSSQARPFVPNQEKDDSNSNTTNTTTNTAQSKEERKTILLQTCQAVAGDALTQKETIVRILFDSGSQRSYITEHLCSKLGLTSYKLRSYT